jgi:hypothetical protein
MGCFTAGICKGLEEREIWRHCRRPNHQKGFCTAISSTTHRGIVTAVLQERPPSLPIETVTVTMHQILTNTQNLSTSSQMPISHAQSRYVHLAEHKDHISSHRLTEQGSDLPATRKQSNAVS